MQVKTEPLQIVKSMLQALPHNLEAVQCIILKTLFIVTLRLCKEDHAMQQQPLPTLQHPKDARHFDKLRRLIIVLSRPWEKLEKGLMH